MMKSKPYWVALVILLNGIALQPGYGEDIQWRDLGFRGGVSDHRNDENFQQYEGSAVWTLPWDMQFPFKWTLGTYFEANAGILTGGGEFSFIASIGPGIYVTGFEEKLDIFVGVNPTITSKHKFGDENFGGPIQFTSHIGLNFNFARYFTIGYRLQHMSTAGLYSPNPGVNMHMIGVAYRF